MPSFTYYIHTVQPVQAVTNDVFTQRQYFRSRENLNVCVCVCVCVHALARTMSSCVYGNISFRSEPLTRKNIYPTDMNDIIVRTIIILWRSLCARGDY